jgi:hypothetical protein
MISGRTPTTVPATTRAKGSFLCCFRRRAAAVSFRLGNANLTILPTALACHRETAVLLGVGWVFAGLLVGRS